MSDWLKKDKDKVIRVNTSALVGLKAALFSKQKEFAKDKKPLSQNELTSTTRQVSEKTSSIWKKAEHPGRRHRLAGKAAGTSRQEERETSTLSYEEEAALERSRRALEEKAALYDRLSKGEGLKQLEEEEEAELGEGQHRYMVDFTKKIVESQVDSRSNKARQEPPQEVKDVQTNLATDRQGGEKKQEEEEEEGGGAADDGDWVEYEDTLGRTRRCLREDLEEMRRRDREMTVGAPPTSDGRQRTPRRSLTPENSHEVEFGEERWASNRNKAEGEEEDIDRPVDQLHYQAVQGGEIRNHGVGYFAFSTDADKRKEQMSVLNDLREKTFAQREKRQQLQEKRKALLDARLAKVKQRRLKKMKDKGFIGEDEQDTQGKGSTQDLADFNFDGAEVKTDEGAVAESVGVASEVSLLLEAELQRSREKARRDEEEKSERKREAHVRPWDRGKVVDPILKRKRELEDERLNEFAPPSAYSKLRGAQRQPFVRASDHTVPRQLTTPPDDDGSVTSEATSLPSTRVTESAGISETEKDSVSGQTSQVSSSSVFNSVPPPPPPPPPLQYHPMYGVPPPYIMGVAPPQVGMALPQVGVAPHMVPPLPHMVFPNMPYVVPHPYSVFPPAPPPGYNNNMMTTPTSASNSPSMTFTGVQPPPPSSSSS